MNKREVIASLKWAAGKRRRRIPDRFLPLLLDIGGYSPGLDGAVIQNVRPQLDHLCDGGMIVIAGGVGIGKTFASLMYALLVPNIRRTEIGGEIQEDVLPPAFWFCSSQLILDNAYDKKEVPKGMKPRKLTDCRDLIIVDDLGREHMKKRSWSHKSMGLFINSRYEENLATIITTNLTMPEFGELYEEHIADRFREHGRWIHTEGDSLRIPSM